MQTPARRPDIEHVNVVDDPRKWSNLQKNMTLFMVSCASLIGGLAANIQNPAVEDMEEKLHATSSQFSLSIALFIIIQGCVPVLWSSVTEIKGRKGIYIVSISIFCAGSIVVATSRTMNMVIGFRCLQAAGSSAVLTIGAATLADIYEPAERGTKMGLYYISISLAAAISPIIGGVLTQFFHWQGPFWFLAIFSGLNVVWFTFLFKDTFRKERSVTYQTVINKYMKERARENAILSKDSSRTAVGPGILDTEKGNNSAIQLDELKAEDIKVGIKDVNPFAPLWQVSRRWNNIITVFASGFMFSYSFVVVYISSRTLSSAYHYNPLKIGLVLVSFGVGSVLGSILGGRYSDYILAKYKEKNGGIAKPEYNTRMGFLPPSIIAFGWVSDQRVNVAAVCVMLFLSGFFLVWIYSSTLSYIVDCNTGRSSTAVALNTSIRGIYAFVATEIAVPLQDAVGDGFMYTIWAGFLIIAELMLLLVIYKGAEWRERAESAERARAVTDWQPPKTVQDSIDGTLAPSYTTNSAPLSDRENQNYAESLANSV